MNNLKSTLLYTDNLKFTDNEDDLLNLPHCFIKLEDKRAWGALTLENDDYKVIFSWDNQSRNGGDIEGVKRIIPKKKIPACGIKYITVKYDNQKKRYCHRSQVGISIYNLYSYDAISQEVGGTISGQSAFLNSFLFYVINLLQDNVSFAFLNENNVLKETSESELDEFYHLSKKALKSPKELFNPLKILDLEKRPYFDFMDIMLSGYLSDYFVFDFCLEPKISHEITWHDIPGKEECIEHINICLSYCVKENAWRLENLYILFTLLVEGNLTYMFQGKKHLEIKEKHISPKINSKLFHDNLFKTIIRFKQNKFPLEIESIELPPLYKDFMLENRIIFKENEYSLQLENDKKINNRNKKINEKWKDLFSDEDYAILHFIIFNRKKEVVKKILNFFKENDYDEMDINKDIFVFAQLSVSELNLLFDLYQKCLDFRKEMEDVLMLQKGVEHKEIVKILHKKSLDFVWI